MFIADRITEETGAAPRSLLRPFRGQLTPNARLVGDSVANTHERHLARVRAAHFALELRTARHCCRSSPRGHRA